MKFFKPTSAKIIISVFFIFLFVPFIHISDPECNTYNALSSHGDGPQSIACLDGVRTVFSYAVLLLNTNLGQDFHGGFNWKVYTSPNYTFLLSGGIFIYVCVCILTLVFIKLKMQMKQNKDKQK